MHRIAERSVKALVGTLSIKHEVGCINFTSINNFVLSYLESTTQQLACATTAAGTLSSSSAVEEKYITNVHYIRSTRHATTSEKNDTTRTTARNRRDTTVQ